MENKNTVLIFSFLKDSEDLERPGKSTVKGKEKEHKMQHVAS